MQFLKVIPLLFLGLFFSACGPKDPAPVYYGYFPLDVGNQWVYENHTLDSTGLETLINRIDTFGFYKDSFIEDKRFFVYEYSSSSQANRTVINLLRDSFGYLINPQGEVFACGNNFTNILREEYITTQMDTLYNIKYQSQHLSELDVLGTRYSPVIDFRGEVVSTQQRSMPRFTHRYYGMNTGMIQEDYYNWPDTIFYRRKLRSYALANK